MTQELSTGTVTIFRQAAAPPFWTKITTYNDYTIRLVTGTAGSGGTAGFSQVFTSTIFSSITGTSSAYSISGIGVSPAVAGWGCHNHTLPKSCLPALVSSNYAVQCVSGLPGNYAIEYGGGGTKYTGCVGGNVPHTHPFVAGPSFPTCNVQVPAGGFRPTTSTSFAVQYVDVIMAQRN